MCVCTARAGADEAAGIQWQGPECPAEPSRPHRDFILPSVESKVNVFKQGRDTGSHTVVPAVSVEDGVIKDKYSWQASTV